MIRLTDRNYLVSKIMISINMASKYINEKLSLRKRNGGHMWVNYKIFFYNSQPIILPTGGTVGRGGIESGELVFFFLLFN